MRITDYGQTIADNPGPAHPLGGATAHMHACQKDDGLTIVLTGTDFSGRRFRMTAGSVSGAFFTMQAVAGLDNAWHVREDGSRKRVIQR